MVGNIDNTKRSKCDVLSGGDEAAEIDGRAKQKLKELNSMHDGRETEVRRQSSMECSQFCLSMKMTTSQFFHERSVN